MIVHVVRVGAVVIKHFAVFGNPGNPVLADFADAVKQRGARAAFHRVERFGNIGRFFFDLRLQIFTRGAVLKQRCKNGGQDKRDRRTKKYALKTRLVILCTANPVADAADGFDVLPGVAQFGAQGADVHVGRARFAVKIIAPDFFEQHIAR